MQLPNQPARGFSYNNGHCFQPIDFVDQIPPDSGSKKIYLLNFFATTILGSLGGSLPFSIAKLCHADVNHWSYLLLLGGPTVFSILTTPRKEVCLRDQIGRGTVSFILGAVASTFFSLPVFFNCFAAREMNRISSHANVTIANFRPY